MSKKSPKPDTDYAAVKSNVDYAERSVAKQREFLENLRSTGMPTQDARRTLENLEQSLELMRRYLRTFKEARGDAPNS